MKCEDVRRGLLEADPRVFDRGARGALADHMRVCTDCGRIAQLLVARSEKVLHEYRVMRPARTAEQAAVAVFARAKADTAAATASDSRLRRATEPRTRRMRKRRGLLVASVMLVPVAAAVLVWAIGSRSEVALDPLSPDTLLQPPVAVEVPPDQNAIVFTTRDPNITVVWLYRGDVP